MIQKEVLSEKVASYLRTRILLGEYPKGFHLSEAQLSKELTVSRGPIREAIHLLENEGLTETPGNGRTLVKGYGKQDVKDLFQLRCMLEALAIRSLIEQGSHHDLSGVQGVQQAMEASTSKSDTIRLDIEYHYQIVKAASNRTLLNMWLMIKGLTSALIEMTTGTYGDIGFVMHSHAEITKSLLAGEADEAIHLLKGHLEIGQQMIITYLEGQYPQTGGSTIGTDSNS
ncbi:GntR family transcriptional regulator [Paenibacillus sp. WQ 127069]|uniref:GntR family transcriptional regulator n=1 Tax=Paenibacillus baimaensis TaxID=2982185 RepID=A0ABT2UPB2_9BACL|nr:GntR family transcriptional regulator [Paenibacillus sp. WQ 127069]MCU6796486.1 GntR family transcriptional regulator [Paenibacillus sp. WQ 127069]